MVSDREDCKPRISENYVARLSMVAKHISDYYATKFLCFCVKKCQKLKNAT